MHIAKVSAWADGPVYTEVPDLPATLENPDTHIRLRILATGLHNVVRVRAAGQHYTSGPLPHVPGVDCVGRDESTGLLYYCMKMTPGFGTFAEYIDVERNAAFLLSPSEAADKEKEMASSARIAASVNPAMSSWMGLTQRTSVMSPERAGKGYTCLVMGATSASGRLAIHAARALGATRVVGCARDADTLSKVEGLDAFFLLPKDPAEFKPGAGFSQELSKFFDDGASEKDNFPDVILDYVYGPAASAILGYLGVSKGINQKRKLGKTVQYVQIGSLGGSMMADIPGAALRALDLELRGAGPGSWRLQALITEMPKLLVEMGKWDEEGKLAGASGDEIVQAPLSDVADVWKNKDLAKKGRIVFIP